MQATRTEKCEQCGNDPWDSCYHKKRLDLYSRVAEKTGVDRQIVKSLALMAMYKAGAPETEEALEQALIAEITGTPADERTK